jgi:hypothetical protein
VEQDSDLVIGDLTSVKSGILLGEETDGTDRPCEGHGVRHILPSGVKTREKMSNQARADRRRGSSKTALQVRSTPVNSVYWTGPWPRGYVFLLSMQLEWLSLEGTR